MAQNTPTPSVGRAYYGFVIYLLGLASLIMYFAWALIPHKYFNYVGIYYLPQPYWALALPSVFIVCLLSFIFFIYPAINMTLCIEPGDIRTVKDSYTIYKDEYENIGGCSIPPIYDLSLSEVNQRLYGDKSSME